LAGPPITGTVTGVTTTMLTADRADAAAHRWRWVGLATFAVAGFLLLSFGGAIAAAPVTLPLLYLASRRHPTKGFRIAAAVIGGLTAAEVGWALTYVALGDAGPWIWLVPLAVAAVAVRLLGRPAPARPA
jgi:hypothetical protein